MKICLVVGANREDAREYLRWFDDRQRGWRVPGWRYLAAGLPSSLEGLPIHSVIYTQRASTNRNFAKLVDCVERNMRKTRAATDRSEALA